MTQNQLNVDVLDFGPELVVQMLPHFKTTESVKRELEAFAVQIALDSQSIGAEHGCRSMGFQTTFEIGDRKIPIEVGIFVFPTGNRVVFLGSKDERAWITNTVLSFASHYEELFNMKAA